MADTLSYNERKIKKGRAECILAENFLKDADKLSHKDKLAHFNRINSLHARVDKPTFHATLEFFPSDGLSDQTMSRIARAYMKKIGFDQQPYAGFRHHDAAHPHMHLVSTKIRQDGSVIHLKDIMLHLSPQAVKELQREFNLHVQPDLTSKEDLKTVSASIRNGLHAVFDDYRFTTLDEYNALLKLYNVRADPGKEGSKMNKRKGLIYYVLDEEGNIKGQPVKASHFDFKPTLRNLEKKFEENEPWRERHYQRVRTAIDWTLMNGSSNLEDFKKGMDKEGIDIELTRDKDGGVQNIFFIDHEKRIIFDGASLGENYNYPAIHNSFVPKQDLSQSEKQALRQQPRPDLY